MLVNTGILSFPPALSAFVDLNETHAFGIFNGRLKRWFK